MCDVTVLITACGKTIMIDAFAHQSDNTTQATADAEAQDHFF